MSQACTLILSPEQQWQVRLDGAALRLQRPGRSSAWVGLARTARVVCGTDSWWDDAALRACQRSHIPIVFARSGGRVVRMVLSPAGGGARWVPNGEGDVAGCEAAFRGSFGDWYRRQQWRAAMIAVRRAGLHGRWDCPMQVHGDLCNRHRAMRCSIAGILFRRARAVLTAHVATSLSTVLAPAWLGMGRASDSLLVDALSSLTAWAIHERLTATAVDCVGKDWRGSTGWLEADIVFYKARLAFWLWVLAARFEAQR